MNRTLPAITAEIVKTVLEALPEVSDVFCKCHANEVEKIVRAALLKVAEETKEAVMPKRMPPSFLSEMEQNFKTFINQ